MPFNRFNREIPTAACVGNSGMGKYHGEWGSRTCTNARGVLYHGTRIDPDLRYPPYSTEKALRELVAS
jgi:hypothetical protein